MEQPVNKRKILKCGIQEAKRSISALNDQLCKKKSVETKKILFIFSLFLVNKFKIIQTELNNNTRTLVNNKVFI